MKKVDKFINWLGGWLPTVWSFLWIISITIASLGAVVCLFKWLFGMLEVL